MSLPGRTRLIAAIKLALSLGFLAWCLNEVPVSELWPMLSQAHIPILLTLAPLLFVEVCAGALRLKVILDTVHVLPIRTHVEQSLIAGYFNVALPSSMGGDAARMVMLTRSGARTADATVMVLVDRVLGVYSLMTVALIAVCVADLPAVLENPIFAFAALLAIAALVATVLYNQTRKLTGRWQWLDSVLTTLHSIRSNPVAIARSAVLSVLYQFLTISFTWVVALGFSISVQPAHVFALVPLTWLATMLPISVGGLGVREVSFTWLFGMVGLPAGEALVLSLGTYAMFVVTALAGALVMALDSKTNTSTP